MTCDFLSSVAPHADSGVPPALTSLDCGTLLPPVRTISRCHCNSLESRSKCLALVIWSNVSAPWIGSHPQAGCIEPTQGCSGRAWTARGLSMDRRSSTIFCVPSMMPTGTFAPAAMRRRSARPAGMRVYRINAVRNNRRAILLAVRPSRKNLSHTQSARPDDPLAWVTDERGDDVNVAAAAGGLRRAGCLMGYAISLGARAITYSVPNPGRAGLARPPPTPVRPLP